MTDMRDSSQIILVVMDILWCAVVVVKEYYVVGLILEVIFLEIAYVLVFVTFYTIVHRLFDNLTDSGRPYTALKAFNWAIVAIVTIITIADLGLWTAEMVKNVDSDLTWALIKHQYKLTTARDIIYFIAALEILACAIFIAVKGKSRFPSKVRAPSHYSQMLHETNKLQTPIHSLIAGAVSWFGYCIMFAIIEIRYYLNQSPYEYLYSYNIPDYQNFVVSLFQFFFVIGVFTGILLCIMQWHKVEEVKDFHTSVSAVQQPYATGPVQYPPHIQQQQHYQQQQYQQPYQQQQYQQQQYQTQQHQP